MGVTLTIKRFYTRYKINLIRTMINRLKRICSGKFLFNKDLKRLKESFLWSGYPNLLIEIYFNICLKRKETGLQNCSVYSRKQIYFGFQYVNETSVNFVKNISKLISKNFNFIKCTPYFKKGRNLLFRRKLKISIEIRLQEYIEFLVTIVLNATSEKQREP